jgi:aminoglycoside phosphotransferase family enzyme/predicted kinase
MSDAQLCLVEALRRQLGAELVETHISWVLLAGASAWKIKKPVTLPFLDYGSLERRHACCRAELTLNRRFAPQLYVAVEPIGGTPDNPCPGAEPAIEWAVRMHRFDESARLDHVCRRGELTPARVASLARRVADFHAAASAAATGTPYGEPGRVLAPALENFSELFVLLPAAQTRLSALETWTRSEHARLIPEFAARKTAGRVRECHGDLHLGNLVLLDDEIVPFDCIEFSDDLRWIDTASEVAFTYLDLIDHRRPDLAAVFINEWLSWSGDYGAVHVLRYYAVYRALVRAKVAGLRGDPVGAEEYVALAERLSSPPPARLTITFGLSGSGKTTAAGTLLVADPAAATLRLRSDVERKRLFGLAPDAASGSPLDGGIYTADATARTYARLCELARLCLGACWSVVVDAAFLRLAERTLFAALAEDLGVPFTILACEAPKEELLRRLAARRGDASEATATVLEKQFDWVEPLMDAERKIAIVP